MSVYSSDHRRPYGLNLKILRLSGGLKLSSPKVVRSRETATHLFVKHIIPIDSWQVDSRICSISKFFCWPKPLFNCWKDICGLKLPRGLATLKIDHLRICSQCFLTHRSDTYLAPFMPWFLHIAIHLTIIWGRWNTVSHRSWYQVPCTHLHVIWVSTHIRRTATYLIQRAEKRCVHSWNQWNGAYPSAVSCCRQTGMTVCIE